MLEKTVVVVLCVIMWIFMPAAANAETFDHQSLYQAFVKVDALDGSIDGYADQLTSRLCAQCHNDKVSEVMQTVHYTFRSENERIAYPGGGSHGHYDRSSGLTGGNTVVNYTFNDEKGCGKCHVGRYLPGTQKEIDPATGLPTANMEKVRNGIDCLVCHSAVYRGRTHVVEAVSDAGEHERYWYQDRTWMAVSNIGRTTTDTCLRCHHEAASPGERGTPFAAWNDVHIASGAFSGNACTKCHQVSQHRYVRGNNVSELFASDYAVGSPENELKCEKCHGETPHKNHAVLNRHIERVACQTCHIPWTSGMTYALWKDDGQQVLYSRSDQYSAVDDRLFITDGLNERQVWEKYKIRPKYLWFNGNASYLAQPYGRRDEQGSKIWPFKPMLSGLPVDASGLRMVDVLDDATIQKALVGTGYMQRGDDPQATATKGIGTIGNRTEDSSLSSSMQIAMYQAPLLFNMDLQVLKDTGNLGFSINRAMRTTMFSFNMLGRLFGADSDTPLLSVFDGSYPGYRYAVVNLPVGSNMQAVLGRPYPMGAYLTLTHGVRKASEALRCNDCHSGGGILNRNEFLILNGYDASGYPRFNVLNNFQVLGYDGRLRGK